MNSKVPRILRTRPEFSCCCVPFLCISWSFIREAGSAKLCLGRPGSLIGKLGPVHVPELGVKVEVKAWRGACGDSSIGA